MLSPVLGERVEINFLRALRVLCSKSAFSRFGTIR